VQYYSVLGKLLVLETEGPVEAVFAALLEKMRGRKEAEELLAAAQVEGGGAEGLLAKLEEEGEGEAGYDNWGVT
jgi:hypothetical protein